MRKLAGCWQVKSSCSEYLKMSNCNYIACLKHLKDLTDPRLLNFSVGEKIYTFSY